MAKIMKYILYNGGNLYYTTDSLVTDLKLAEDFLHNKLGKIKLEHSAYFITDKTYKRKKKQKKGTKNPLLLK